MSRCPSWVRAVAWSAETSTNDHGAWKTNFGDGKWLCLGCSKWEQAAWCIRGWHVRVCVQHLAALGTLLVLLLVVLGFCRDPQVPGWISGEFQQKAIQGIAAHWVDAAPGRLSLAKLPGAGAGLALATV